jgi:hypothetical protein
MKHRRSGTGCRLMKLHAGRQTRETTERHSLRGIYAGRATGLKKMEDLKDERALNQQK